MTHCLLLSFVPTFELMEKLLPLRVHHGLQLNVFWKRRFVCNCILWTVWLNTSVLEFFVNMLTVHQRSVVLAVWDIWRCISLNVEDVLYWELASYRTCLPSMEIISQFYVFSTSLVEIGMLSFTSKTDSP